MDAPMEIWSRRLGDAVRTALDAGETDEARRLALEGDGLTRNLAKEFSLMARGLAITIRVELETMVATAARFEGQPGAQRAVDEAAETIHRFRAFLADRFDLELAPKAVLADEAKLAADTLDAAVAAFEKAQAAITDQAVAAIDGGDAARARALLVAKDEESYLPFHDAMIRLMADGMGWALRCFGDDELTRFQMAMAEGQRHGFEAWDKLSARDFARVSAFLLRQHMGEATVTEDDEKFTIDQAVCGSGGRLRINGAYDGPEALPFVENAGPLTFGKDRLPVYCSHCPIWNGSASIRWFGYPQWVYSDASREDGGCVLHIYKSRDATPSDFRKAVTLPDAV
ncbi:MAG: hypothetical protein ACMVY4_14640 [Minwuia sp.]|uniref:hypothetical protein n=1 Tax=Minwuia sp. TaxID=2493630 RepID=UPI003A860464